MPPPDRHSHQTHTQAHLQPKSVVDIWIQYYYLSNLCLPHLSHLPLPLNAIACEHTTSCCLWLALSHSCWDSLNWGHRPKSLSLFLSLFSPFFPLTPSSLWLRSFLLLPSFPLIFFSTLYLCLTCCHYSLILYLFPPSRTLKSKQSHPTPDTHFAAI